MKVLLVFVIAAVASSAVGHKGPQGHHHGPPKCNGVELKFTDEMKASGKTCLDKYMPEKGMHKDNKGVEKKDLTKEQKEAFFKNMTCVHVCKYQAAGLISSEGVIVKDKIAAYVQSIFPEAVHATITTDVGKCVDEKAAGVEMKDGKCEVFQPFNKCVFEAIRKACKTEGEKDEEE